MLMQILIPLTMVFPLFEGSIAACQAAGYLLEGGV